MNFEQVVELVKEELTNAKIKHGDRTSFNSTHEGYAVILEELDEAWGAIKKDNIFNVQKEMVQVAAMAVQFLIDFGTVQDTTCTKCKSYVCTILAGGCPNGKNS